MPPTPDDRWRRWVEGGAHRTLAFAEQWEVFRDVFPERDPGASPPVVWRPDAALREGSNLGRFLRRLGLSDYEALHAWSASERDAFWKAVLERLGVVMASAPSAVLEEAPVERARWLVGARLNVVDSCFGAPAGAPAIVWRSEGSAEIHSLSYGELEERVDAWAAGYGEARLPPRSRLGFYLPLTAECVAAYLGAVRAGHEIVSIASSFATDELARRLEIGGCAALVTMDSFRRAGRSISPYAVAIEAGAPRAIVISAGEGRPDTPRRGDLTAEELLGRRLAPMERDVGEVDRTTNVLFSSGTTGEPKAIPWSHLQPIKCAMDGHFHQDIRSGDVVAWPTDIGWMMGPWLIYAALINRATIALFDGAPTGAEFARFVEGAGVTVLGVVPSLVRQWRRSGATEGVDWSGIRIFSSTGEASGQEDYLWLMSRAGYRTPVIEYCGGTEVGGGYVTGAVLQEASPATFTTPALGLDIAVLDDAGRPVAEGEAGEVYLVPPSIGLSTGLLNADHQATYYVGCPAGPGGETLRRHGDRMTRLPGGFVRAEGRADDTMNLAGIKVSSMEIERHAGRHPAVVESAAVAAPEARGGPEELVLFVVARAGTDVSRLQSEINRELAEHLNPLFRVARLERVASLPRTASNKVMRRSLRDRLAKGAG